MGNCASHKKQLYGHPNGVVENVVDKTAENIRQYEVFVAYLGAANRFSTDPILVDYFMDAAKHVRSEITPSHFLSLVVKYSEETDLLKRFIDIWQPSIADCDNTIIQILQYCGRVAKFIIPLLEEFKKNHNADGIAESEINII